MDNESFDTVYNHIRSATKLLDNGKETLNSLVESMESDDSPTAELISALSQHARASIEAGNLHMRIAEFVYNTTEVSTND